MKNRQNGECDVRSFRQFVVPVFIVRVFTSDFEF